MVAAGIEPASMGNRKIPEKEVKKDFPDVTAIPTLRHTLPRNKTPSCPLHSSARLGTCHGCITVLLCAMLQHLLAIQGFYITSWHSLLLCTNSSTFDSQSFCMSNHTATFAVSPYLLSASISLTLCGWAPSSRRLGALPFSLRVASLKLSQCLS